MPFQRSFLKNQRYTRIGWVFIFAIIHLLFLFWVAPSALAQLAPLPDVKVAPPTPGVAPQLEAIPLSDIAKRLESSRRQIRDVSERVQDLEVAEIANEIA